MAAIHGLLKQINDPSLRSRLEEEFSRITQDKKFGLVFEEHIPECTPLYGVPVKRGSTVARKAEKKIDDVFSVINIKDGVAVCIKTGTDETVEIPVDELVSVAKFGEAIFPTLQPVDYVENAPDSSLWHTLIEADNYHALQLLEYLYPKQVDCIYIDPPYNTRANDWKYNNDYVDPSDGWKHSKWLSMMKKRLKIARNLLADDGVLITTIDDNEYAHLWMLLNEIFPEYTHNTVTIQHNPGGTQGKKFSVTNEYAIFTYSANSVIFRKPHLGGDTYNLRRWGSTSGRYEGATCFYPVILDTNHSIIGFGDILDDEKHPSAQVEPQADGTIYVWPIDKNGNEKKWRYGRETVNTVKDRMFTRTSGDRIEIILRRESEPPKTVWVDPLYNAEAHGTDLLKTILSGNFPYPKSLYAVHDSLLFAVLEKKDALVLDFFAGSGTTLHAVNLLNAEDGGHHRGTAQSAQEAEKAHSIMQKFIKGSEEDGLCPMPLVIGVTATPEKFNRLVEGTTSTVQKVPISAAKVRESGLLKDRIILAIPNTPVSADMTTFANAVDNWLEKCAHWTAYYDPAKQEDRKINPILVIQVEDGSSGEATRTDIGACIHMVEEKLGRDIAVGEVVHTFNDYGNIPVGDLIVRQVDASRIEEDEQIKIVFFKMNLSTGWDCPRAETMMSFRGAQDATYIAQLLGRMIRTPLARRIKTDAFLNDVSLYLPHFDKKTAEDVIKALRDNEAVYPGEVGTDKEFITLKQNLAFADVFAGMTKLVTYQIDTNRKQAYLRLYMNIARNLTMDGIVPTAQRNAKNAITAKMEKEITRIKASGHFEEIRSNLTGFKMGTMTFGYGDITYVYDENARVTKTIEYDIVRHFEQAGKILGEGLHREYWGKHADEDHIDVKIDVIVLANDVTAMENLNSFAKAEFIRLYEENSRAISQLSDARKAVYDRMIHASSEPIPTPWNLPSTIDFTIGEGAEVFDRHLYCREDGTFAANLSPWESGIVHEELSNGAVCWLRNLDRKNWALEIPYEVNGVVTPMYPDLLVVRVDTYGYIYDILEPHDYSRKDNCPKAVGLAKFADKHHDSFGRIQLIREKTGPDGRKHFYRLDMSKVSVCNKVRGITTNPELDRIFDEEGFCEN